MLERTRKGLILLFIGAIVFIISFFFILPLEEYYIISLVLMFVGVVFIGVGSAMAKGFDRSIEIPSDVCYFCEGTGMVDTPEGKKPCPRCGGTGISPDSYEDNE